MHLSVRILKPKSPILQGGKSIARRPFCIQRSKSDQREQDLLKVTAGSGGDVKRYETQQALPKQSLVEAQLEALNSDSPASAYWGVGSNVVTRLVWL